MNISSWISIYAVRLMALVRIIQCQFLKDDIVENCITIMTQIIIGDNRNQECMN